MLCHLHHIPRHMLWKKTEGYQLWWSICWWVRVQAVSVEGGCSVFKGGQEFGQGGQIPALLDHHHLHLHLHLLHNHLQCLQCLLHPDWWQRVRLIYQLDLSFIFCNVWLIYILWTQKSLFMSHSLWEYFFLFFFLTLIDLRCPHFWYTLKVMHWYWCTEVWKNSGQSGKFWNSLESFRTVSKVSDSLKSFRTVWKVFEQFGTFLDRLASF